MTKYREIIRLTGLGFSQRDIMASCGVAQKTVVKVQKRARELKLSWPLDEAMTDTELQRLMFSKENQVSPNKRMPDYDYIHKELRRYGVIPCGCNRSQAHAFEDGCLVLDKTTFREPHLFDCLAKASKALIPEPFLRLSKQCFWNTEHLMLCSCC